MQTAISETLRRRKIQLQYNKDNNITPTTIRKAIRTALADQLRAREVAREAIHASPVEFDQTEMLTQLETEMFEAAEALEYEKAAALRDRVQKLKAKLDAKTAKAGK
jgi:excinuclease ABC subunit B